MKTSNKVSKRVTKDEMYLYLLAAASLATELQEQSDRATHLASNLWKLINRYEKSNGLSTPLYRCEFLLEDIV